MKRGFCIVFAMLLLDFSGTVIAQSENEKYYEVFEDLLTTRLYFSRKFTSLRINDRKENRVYLYQPGSTLNMGIGATYNWATLNLAYGFGFLNPDTRADTRYLDLQAHAYPKKVVIDLFGQFYKGYNLNIETDNQEIERYYERPDIVTTKIGASVQYLFNYNKFSFRAASLQNEWQKKSAGTFLLGFEMYGGRARGDSALVPYSLIDENSRNFDRTRYFDFGPNTGYAYSLIIHKNFFITASVSGSMLAGYSIQDGPFYREMQWGVRPNVFLRTFAGYNSARWSINGNYIINNLRLVSDREFTNSIRTGNYRLNFVYRFMPPPRLNKYLRKLRLDPETEEEIQTP